MAFSKEVKVGLLALTAGIILYLGFNFLKGIDFFSPTRSYYVIYDNVEGLTVSNPILVNGLSVGRVHSIKIMQKRNHKLLVRLEIDKEIAIGDSSVAILSSPSLLEGKAIVLNIRTSKGYLQENDTLIADKEKSFTEILSARATPALKELDTTLMKVNRILLQIETEERLRNILRNVDHITANLTRLVDKGGKMDQVTNNIEVLTRSLTETSKKIDPVLENMNRFSSRLNELELAQTISSTNKSVEKLNRLLANIEQGNGSMGKLVKDDSLYINLNNAAADLDKLLIDIQKRPKRYINFSVFGGKTK